MTSSQALEAWVTLRETFLRPGPNGALEVWEGRGGGRAPLWPHSQVLAAAIDIGALTGDLAPAEALTRGLAPFGRGEAYVPRPRQRRHYFDDNAWVGLDLLRLHAQTGEAAHLANARRLFGFVAAGQDADGGVRWVQGRTTRNACATAPASQLALGLHLIEPDASLPAFARRAMDWLDRTLRPASGLIADREDRGRVDATVWSYNQGASLGAYGLLFDVEGRTEDRDAAIALARASLEHFTGEVLWTQPPVFNAVWFRNLLSLGSLAPAGVRDALDAYLERVWSAARDRGTGQLTGGGIGSYDGHPAIDHGGLVQLFALRAR